MSSEILPQAEFWAWIYHLADPPPGTGQPLLSLDEVAERLQRELGAEAATWWEVFEYRTRGELGARHMKAMAAVLRAMGGAAQSAALTQYVLWIQRHKEVQDVVERGLDTPWRQHAQECLADHAWIYSLLDELRPGGGGYGGTGAPLTPETPSGEFTGAFPRRRMRGG